MISYYCTRVNLIPRNKTWNSLLYYITLLKVKNASNATSVTFNPFPLIKRTYSSWVAFSPLTDFLKWIQTCVFWVHSNLIRYKSAFSEVLFWSYWPTVGLCAFHKCTERQNLLNALFNPQQFDWNRLIYPFVHEDTFHTENQEMCRQII